MRYLPLTPTDRRDMLSVIGTKSVDELFRDVPASARLPGKVSGLPDHLGELEVERAFQSLAAKNVSPSTAPFRSTTWIKPAPCCCHWRATADTSVE